MGIDYQAINGWGRTGAKVRPAVGGFKFRTCPDKVGVPGATSPTRYRFQVTGKGKMCSVICNKGLATGDWQPVT